MIFDSVAILSSTLCNKFRRAAGSFLVLYPFVHLSAAERNDYKYGRKGSNC